MTKREKIKTHLRRLRKIVAEHPSRIFKLNKEDAIKKLRKTREAIWEEKLAHRH